MGGRRAGVLSSVLALRNPSSPSSTGHTRRCVDGRAFLEQVGLAALVVAEKVCRPDPRQIHRPRRLKRDRRDRPEDGGAAAGDMRELLASRLASCRWLVASPAAARSYQRRCPGCSPPHESRIQHPGPGRVTRLSSSRRHGISPHQASPPTKGQWTRQVHRGGVTAVSDEKWCPPNNVEHSSAFSSSRTRLEFLHR